MAAPPSDFIAASRNGAVSRNVFFKMTHTAGTVYAWDGIGEFVVDGHTYAGVRGLIGLQGVSESHDVQEPAIEILLAAVPASALQEVGTKVRGEDVTIFGAWIDRETGVISWQRTLFTGKAKQMIVDPRGDSFTIKVRARGALYGWHVVPNVYYLNRDQDRLYGAGLDDGFKYVPGLENSTISGWGPSPEAAGGRPKYYVASGDYRILYDDVTEEIIGHDAYGLTLTYDDYPSAATAFSNNNTAGKVAATFTGFVEDGTSAPLEKVASGSIVTVGGVECYVDEFGDVRTAGGNLVVAGGSGTGYQLRHVGAISAIGTAGANQIQRSSIPSNLGYPMPTPSAYVNWCWEVTNQPSGNDFSGLVFCNKYGVAITVQDFGGSGWEVARYDPSGPIYRHYVEEDTGIPVYFNGSSRLATAAGVCTISSTGAVRTPAGKFVVQDGGPAEAFLRVWT